VEIMAISIRLVTGAGLIGKMEIFILMEELIMKAMFHFLYRKEEY